MGWFNIHMRKYIPEITREISDYSQNITCFATVYTKAVLLANKGFGETQAFSNHSTGIRRGLLTGRHATGNRIHHHGRGLMHAVATHQARACSKVKPEKCQWYTAFIELN